MVIIIVTIVTQGAFVDPDLRGNVRGLLLVNDGFFQAIGVISFGTWRSCECALTTANSHSLCLSP